MTVVVVLASPPRPGLVCSSLPETTPLSASEAADLYAASLADTLRAAEQAGGQLLVNYRPAETIPDGESAADGEATAESQTTLESKPGPAAAVRALASEALADVTDARFEPQVGSTPSARLGNTVTHLLREEDADSVAVLRPVAPLVRRSTVDSGVMKLRSNQTVVGATPAGDYFFAGFTDPLAFDDALADPAVQTLTDRARDADHEVDFLPVQPAVDTPAGLSTLVPLLRARVRAERVVPTETATFLHDHDLAVRDGAVVRENAVEERAAEEDAVDESP
jgi:glycosyltransferase A (GT-A) superfamily protein (DUF2064 family)